METFENYALKVGIYSWLNECMKNLDYKRSGYLLTFDTGLSYFDSFKHHLKITGPIVTRLHI